MIQYLVTTTKDSMIIELEEDWKLTFAAVNPAAAGNYRSEGFCLRVYDEKKRLRAVFDSVVNFRDMSIPLARKVQREVGSSSWTKDSEGNFEGAQKIEVDETLVIESGEEIEF